MKIYLVILSRRSPCPYKSFKTLLLQKYLNACLEHQYVASGTLVLQTLFQECGLVDYDFVHGKVQVDPQAFDRGKLIKVYLFLATMLLFCYNTFDFNPYVIQQIKIIQYTRAKHHARRMSIFAKDVSLKTTKPTLIQFQM